MPAAITNSLTTINYRSLVCVFLLLEHCHLVEDNTAYLYSKQLAAAHITNFNRFRNIAGNDIVMLEYWTSEGEAIWQMNDENMVALAKKDLSEFLQQPGIKIKESKIIRLKNAYEIPDIGFQKIKADIAAYLQSIDGLIIAGCANQHNFNYGMGDAIADGYNKALKIVTELNDGIMIKK